MLDNYRRPLPQGVQLEQLAENAFRDGAYLAERSSILDTKYAVDFVVTKCLRLPRPMPRQVLVQVTCKINDSAKFSTFARKAEYLQPSAARLYIEVREHNRKLNFETFPFIAAIDRILVDRELQHDTLFRLHIDGLESRFEIINSVEDFRRSVLPSSASRGRRSSSPTPRTGARVSGSVLRSDQDSDDESSSRGRGRRPSRGDATSERSSGRDDRGRRSRSSEDSKRDSSGRDSSGRDDRKRDDAQRRDREESRSRRGGRGRDRDRDSEDRGPAHDRDGERDRDGGRGRSASRGRSRGEDAEKKQEDGFADLDSSPSTDSGDDGDSRRPRRRRGGRGRGRDRDTESRDTQTGDEDSNKEVTAETKDRGGESPADDRSSRRVVKKRSGSRKAVAAASKDADAQAEKKPADPALAVKSNPNWDEGWGDLEGSKRGATKKARRTRVRKRTRTAESAEDSATTAADTDDAERDSDPDFFSFDDDARNKAEEIRQRRARSKRSRRGGADSDDKDSPRKAAAKDDAQESKEEKSPSTRKKAKAKRVTKKRGSKKTDDSEKLKGTLKQWTRNSKRPAQEHGIAVTTEGVEYYCHQRSFTNRAMLDTLREEFSEDGEHEISQKVEFSPGRRKRSDGRYPATDIQ